MAHATPFIINFDSTKRPIFSSLCSAGAPHTLNALWELVGCSVNGFEQAVPHTAQL